MVESGGEIGVFFAKGTRARDEVKASRERERSKGGESEK